MSRISAKRHRKTGGPAGAAWLLLLVAAGTPGCLLHSQQFSDFTVQRPLAEDRFLVLGFVGGRQRWDNPSQGVRRFALQLRSSGLPLEVETVENQKRALALRLISEVLDRNRDGRLDDVEKQNARLILYGQSFGGAAVVKLARQLHQTGIPVRLTIQIDSIGRGDGLIPPNVVRAANLFQKNGWLIRGEGPIRAEDDGQTEIVGNFRFRYRKGDIELSGLRWYKRLFRVAHAKMDRDPRVWEQMYKLIEEETRR